MRKKMIWGIATLIVLLLGVNAFLLLRNTDTEPTEPKVIVNDVEPDKRHKRPDMIAIENYENKPNDGNEYEWHGDHWHRVPNPDSPRLVDMEPAKSILKESDLPDELPAEFPTEAELQQMPYEDVHHLYNLYRQKVMEIRKTDYDASVKYNNAIMPKLNARLNEISAQISKDIRESNRRLREELPIIRPQTEESPAVVVEIEPSPNEKNKGGNQ